MGRRTLLVVASILLAALGTALVWLYVQGAVPRELESKGITLVQVPIFNGSAEAGLPVENLPLTRGKVSAEVAAGAVRDLASVRGSKLATDATPGQILTAGMLTTGAVSGIPRDLGFVSLTIADPHRVPALLKAGVDVALYVVPQGQGGCVRLMVPRVRVYRVGSDAPSTGSQVPATIVGFLADPKTNVKIIESETLGTPVLELLGVDAKAAQPDACPRTG